METLMEPYFLVDAEERARETPDTFLIPPRALRSVLRCEDMAKLIFSDKERMWVEIVKVTHAVVAPQTTYLGTLQNVPIDHGALKVGDLITFEPRHIIDVALGGSPSPSERRA
jgi:hypothetical protein